MIKGGIGYSSLAKRLLVLLWAIGCTALQRAKSGTPMRKVIRKVARISFASLLHKFTCLQIWSGTRRAGLPSCNQTMATQISRLNCTLCSHQDVHLLGISYCNVLLPERKEWERAGCSTVLLKDSVLLLVETREMKHVRSWDPADWIGLIRIYSLWVCLKIGKPKLPAWFLTAEIFPILLCSSNISSSSLFRGASI